MNIENVSDRKRLLAGAAIAVLVVGGGGILVGRTMVAPSEAVLTEANGEEAGKEKGHVEGLIEMDVARAKAAGIVTEVTQAGGLGSEIIAQGVVAAAPDLLVSIGDFPYTDNGPPATTAAAYRETRHERFAVWRAVSGTPAMA